jgi:hypothetical protein
MCLGQSSSLFSLSANTHTHTYTHTQSRTRSVAKYILPLISYKR